MMVNGINQVFAKVHLVSQELAALSQLLHLADHICQAYLEGDAEMKQLVHSTRIHLLPSMNPDGWKISDDIVSITDVIIKVPLKGYNRRAARTILLEGAMPMTWT